jgi:hypothetical protein
MKGFEITFNGQDFDVVPTELPENFLSITGYAAMMQVMLNPHSDLSFTEQGRKTCRLVAVSSSKVV